ncbi:MAG TPA: 50S ribosomal protein L19 [Kiritimatiellia bacterium]|nr:50S ribosomal protein L19 [Kiritimatiellia bacterium]
MATNILEKIDQEQRKDRSVPDFNVGDNIKVHVKIREGDKERIQMYAGTVIARDGTGSTETFTVRRISYGEGVERIFPLYSPSLAKIEIERSGQPKRAKLYYLRKLTGKKTKIKEKVAKEDRA